MPSCDPIRKCERQNSINQVFLNWVGISGNFVFQLKLHFRVLCVTYTFRATYLPLRFLYASLVVCLWLVAKIFDFQKIIELKIFQAQKVLQDILSNFDFLATSLPSADFGGFEF